MAQNFWTAIYAWTTCFLVSVAVSLATRQTKTDRELTGLVYSLTPKITDAETVWWKRPRTLGWAVMLVVIGLNIVFW